MKFIKAVSPLIQSVDLFDVFVCDEKTYLTIRRKELKKHAENTNKNMVVWKVLNALYPVSKVLMEKLYWHP